jgi:ferredoxin/NAD-dependent dihydropyrimidine dehydrogenase PreA subunit
MTVMPLAPPRRLLDLEIDGETIRVAEGSTILDALRAKGVDTPTLCYAENLTPVNACRVCVVELEGARVLVPSCARKVEEGMKVKTDTERVRHSRRMVLEFLGSTVDLGLADAAVTRWMQSYEADPARYGPAMEPANAGERDTRHAGHHHDPDGAAAETVHQPVKVDNELYVRDYSRCILCYKCVEACGVDAQNTFAIAVGVCLLRQLHRGLSDRCLDVPERVRDAAGRHVGRDAPDHDRDDLPVLRRRMRSRGPRAGQHHREGDLALGPLGHERTPVHQGSLRVPVRAESRAGPERADGRDRGRSRGAALAGGPACLT